MARSARQIKLLDIIARNDIGRQEELVEKLKEAGFNVTQATISRDIKDLQLMKVLNPNGGYKYVAKVKESDDIYTKLLNIFKVTVKSIKAAENLIVIKTEAGSTGPTAEFIDRMDMKEILGVIAGENTIFVAVDSIYNTQKVVDAFEDILEG